MADPLSPATRAIKRNLLVASVLAISANAFNVSVDKIPIGGLSITFDERLFAFLILVVLIYFLGTFILYYIIDIKNLEQTPHQTATEKLFRTRQSNFDVSYGDVIGKALQRAAGPKYQVQMSGDGYGNPGYSFGYVVYLAANPGDAFTAVERFKNEALFDKLDKIQSSMIQGQVRAKSAYRRRAAISKHAVNFMYLTRNYFLDGFLPIALGFIALAANLGLVKLDWLQGIVPSFNIHHTFDYTSPLLL